MSRPGITYQEVANAAIQLQGQNQNPTVDRVREILGTGSKSTIARYLRDWKSKTDYIAGSDGIPHELTSIIKGLWERLKSESDTQIIHHKREADVAINEIKQSLSKEQQRNRDLQTQLHHLDEQLHQERHQTQILHVSLEEEKRSNAKLSERNDRLSEQFLNQKSETERLHQLLSHVQNNLEHYQLSVQKLREEQTLSIEKQKSVYEHETTALKKELIVFTDFKNRLQLENQQFQSEIKLLKDQEDKLLEEMNLYSNQLQEKIVIEVTLKAQIKQLKADQLINQDKIQQLLTTINNNEKNIAILNDQIIHLRKSLEDSENHNHMLRDEKLFLVQEKSQLEGQLKQAERILFVQSNKVVAQ